MHPRDPGLDGGTFVEFGQNFAQNVGWDGVAGFEENPLEYTVGLRDASCSEQFEQLLCTLSLHDVVVHVEVAH